MKEIKKYLDKEKRKMVDSIEVYLELKGFKLINFKHDNSSLIEGKEFYFYRYNRKSTLESLIICCSFYYHQFDGIYLDIFYNFSCVKETFFGSIEEFRNFLVEVF